MSMATNKNLVRSLNFIHIEAFCCIVKGGHVSSVLRVILNRSCMRALRSIARYGGKRLHTY